jgi:hypothetical protein
MSSDLLSLTQNILQLAPDDPLRWSILLETLASLYPWIRSLELENHNLKKDVADLRTELSEIGADEEVQGRQEIDAIWGSLKDWLNTVFIGREADKGRPAINWDAALSEYLEARNKLENTEKDERITPLVLKHSKILMVKMKGHYGRRICDLKRHILSKAKDRPIETVIKDLKPSEFDFASRLDKVLLDITTKMEIAAAEKKRKRVTSLFAHRDPLTNSPPETDTSANFAARFGMGRKRLVVEVVQQIYKEHHPSEPELKVPEGLPYLREHLSTSPIERATAPALLVDPVSGYPLVQLSAQTRALLATSALASAAATPVAAGASLLSPNVLGAPLGTPLAFGFDATPTLPLFTPSTGGTSSTAGGSAAPATEAPPPPRAKKSRK